MRAGRLDRRITLQRFTATQDAYGEPIETWADYVTVWARVEPLRGRERFEAQREHAEVDTRFHLRYRDDLTVEDRITYEGDLYDIEAILETGRHEGLEILGRAVQP
ncbi:MAG: phage head closure protein [Dehalococcoidia bacterium]|nr:phage head closure protein [Dehalococcoidia bacterium]